MKPFRLAFALPVVLLSFGCGDTPPEVDRTPIEPDVELKWPGAPHESTSIADLEPVIKSYNAMYAQRKDGSNDVVMFGLDIQKFEKQTMKGRSGIELLEATIHAFKDKETSRRAFAFGPNQSPAFETMTLRSEKYTRRIAVIQGQRTYHVSVMSKQEADVTGPEAQAFLDSFRILSPGETKAP